MKKISLIALVTAAAIGFGSGANAAFNTPVYGTDFNSGLTSMGNIDGAWGALATELGTIGTVTGADTTIIGGAMNDLGLAMQGLYTTAYDHEDRIGDLETDMALKADAATTLAGYGITNAYTKTEVDTKFSDAMTLATNKWNEAQAMGESVTGVDFDNAAQVAAVAGAGGLKGMIDTTNANLATTNAHIDALELEARTFAATAQGYLESTTGIDFDNAAQVAAVAGAGGLKGMIDTTNAHIDALELEARTFAATAQGYLETTTGIDFDDAAQMAEMVAKGGLYGITGDADFSGANYAPVSGATSLTGAVLALDGTVKALEDEAKAFAAKAQLVGEAVTGVDFDAADGTWGVATAMSTATNSNVQASTSLAGAIKAVDANVGDLSTLTDDRGFGNEYSAHHTGVDNLVDALIATEKKIDDIIRRDGGYDSSSTLIHLGQNSIVLDEATGDMYFDGDGTETLAIRTVSYLSSGAAIVADDSNDVTNGGNGFYDIATVRETGDVRDLRAAIQTGALDEGALNLTNAMNYVYDYTLAEIDRLDNRIDGVSKEMRAGFASLSAMSALVPNARSAGNTQVSVGTGGYRDQVGVAAGVFHYVNNGTLLNAGASYSKDNVAWRAGVTFGF